MKKLTNKEKSKKEMVTQIDVKLQKSLGVVQTADLHTIEPAALAVDAPNQKKNWRTLFPASLLQRMDGAVVAYAKALFLGYGATRESAEFFTAFPENMYLDTEDGERIVCHGKGCNRYHAGLFGNLAALPNHFNVCLLLLDYRGFGDSSGEYSIKGVNYDVLAAFRFLKENFLAKEISLIGHSLGTAVALEYGRFSIEQRPEYAPCHVFLIAPFVSTVGICKEFVAYRFLCYLLPDLENLIYENFNYDSLENARRVGDRVFVLHGSNDNIIPISHGRLISNITRGVFIETNHNHLTVFSDHQIWKKVFELNMQGLASTED